ncbi:MAG: hypothetical protein Q8P07_00710 [bacterium]|nr:hypothetical protein [bacterium]
MKYRTRFLSVLTAVYFGMFLGIAGSGEHQDRQKGKREGNHHHQQRRQQQQPRHQQRQPQFNRGQQQSQQQPRFNQGEQRRQDRQIRQHPGQTQSEQKTEQVRRPRDDERKQGDVERGRKDRDKRPGVLNRERHNRPDNRRGNEVYRDWRGHRDFRPAHVNRHYYQYRHRHFVHYFTHERYRTWRHRHHVFYGVYLPRTYVVYYDGINPYWIFWLRDNPRYFAIWVYNHRFEISAERYEALLLENEELREQIRALEERNAPVDYNYIPPEVDEDMPYSEEYIEKYRQR